MQNSHAGALPVNPLSSFPFARDWIEERGAAREFFLPADDGFAAAIAARDQFAWQPWSAGEIAEVRDFNEQMGNAAGAGMAEQLADARCLAIVTGQQPNLFASPLFILHKALSARAHAAAVSQRTGRPVVPVFWVASDDHDFRELRDCWLLQQDGALANLGEVCSRGDAAADSPSYLWSLGESAPRLRERANEWLPDECNRRTATQLLRDVLTGEPRFESVFCRTLAALLGPERPMLFVAPRLAVFRNRQRDLLRQSFEAGPEIADALQKSSDGLVASGYPPGLQRDPDVLNAFYLKDGRRLRMVRADGMVQLQDSLRHTSVDTMGYDQVLAELDEHPERFSPNVATRPILQDIVLPTAAYIGGPGEVVYLAQLREIYRLHGVARPAVALRSLVTCLDACTLAALEELEISTESADWDSAAVEERILSRDPQTGRLLQSMRKLEMDAIANLASMRQDPAMSHPHVAVAVEKTARSIAQSISRMRGRLARQVTRASWNKYARAMSVLAPFGGAQERWLSPLNFVIGEDPARLSAQLAAGSDYTSPYPQIVRIDGAR